ncbi:hypothetical protein Tco_1334665 [Tanacetum coccineum]
MSTLDRILKLRIASVDLTMWEGRAYESERFGGMWGGQRGMRVTCFGCYVFGDKGTKKMYSSSKPGCGFVTNGPSRL